MLTDRDSINGIVWSICWEQLVNLSDKFVSTFYAELVFSLSSL